MNEWFSEIGVGEETVSLILSYGARVLGVLVILFLALMVAGWIKKVIVNRLTKIGFDVTLTKFIGSMARWAIMIFAILGCLGLFGVETTSFAAVIGGASLAIGLAFQGSLSNIAAGAMLLLFRPYKVGDVVTVDGQTGGVDAIDLFTTTLDTPDNRRIIVPNGKVFGNTIENITYHPKRRVDVSVGVGYEADIEATRAVLTEAAESVIGRLETEPVGIVLTGLGSSSVDWAVRIWAPTAEYWPVQERTLKAVKKSLDAAGIDIPYPHQVNVQK